MLANLRPDLSKENLKCTADCNPFFCPPAECNSFANSQRFLFLSLQPSYQRIYIPSIQIRVDICHTMD